MARIPVTASLLAILAVHLAGCQTGNGVVIGTPHLGDTAMYESERGMELRVRTVGVNQAIDTWGRPVEVLELLYEFTPGPAWGTYHLREWLDARGLVVGHQARCTFPLGPDASYPNAASPECATNRTSLYFGAAGQPGALGASVFWFNQKGNHATFHVDDAGSCSRVDYSANAAEAMVPIVVNGGQATICGHAPYPTRFVSSLAWPTYMNPGGKPTEFLLVEFTPGNEEVTPPRHDEGERDSPRLALSTPLYLNPAPDDLPFPTRTAIEEARRLQPDVAEYLGTHPDAVPVASIYVKGSSFTDPVQGNQSRDGRRIWLAADNECKYIAVDRTTSTKGLLLGQDQTTYSTPTATDVYPPCPLDPLDRARIAPEQLAYETAMALVQPLVGLPSQQHLSGYSQIIGGTGWTDPGGYRPDGYALVLKFQDPYPATSSGVRQEVPYDAWVDGPSGRILFVMLPP